MKTKTYLTPDLVRQLTPGETYHLGYDDFNRGRFEWKFKEAKMEQGPFGPRLEATGEHQDEDANGEHWEHKFYQHDGPHRDRSFTPVMCSGSGAERIFFTKVPKAIKL